MTTRTKALKLLVEALSLYETRSDGLVNKALAAGKKALAQPEQEPVAWLTDDERKAFERFNETCEDGEGYDVPKTMMKRLAEIGVIHHTSRGIYGITKFGRSLVGYTTPPQRKPLTDEQFLELLLRKGTQELVGVTTFVGGSIQMQGKIGLLRSAKIIKEFVEAAHGLKE